MTDSDNRARLIALLRDSDLCMLTTMTKDGRHLSRPMSLQKTEFDGDLWFFAFEDSDVAAQIRDSPQVNVAVSDKGKWISVSGRAEVCYDRDRAAQLWHKGLEAWFPEGLDTPGLTMIKVTAESAQYWATPHGRMVTMLEYAAAAVLHTDPPEGEQASVRLR
ncbi:MAG TPA: pyridoxamine 5'-phosphate oxidase family protein [Pilimelia sp.]|nr:pyridoxamine 5'-phosphate oxidase family protein [Pilimelia sp.]